MALNAASALIGGVAGWILKGKGGNQQPEPVDFAAIIEDLRSRKPTTYRVITLDATQAHDRQVVTFSGDNIAVYLNTASVDFNIRLNEADKDELNISQMKRVSLPFYRFFYSNNLGTGSLILIVSLGGDVTPRENVDVDVESDPFVFSGTLASRPAASLTNRLFWATDVKILYRDTGSAWEHVGSQIISDVVANRPAASLLDRYFWATDENILYHDTGSAWEKAAVADHADLDGVGANDHHDSSNDPSSGEKAALAGTSGTPGAGNPYVTDADARNSDSREWTASTVSQAEAEAGTATTRRAWTAQRVAQAIAALGGAAVMAASDALRLASADTERAEAQQSVWVEHKAFTVNASGTLRVLFDVRASASPGICTGRVKRNGNVVGTNQSNNTTSYVTKSQDLSGWSVGDALTIEIIVSADSSNTGFIRNARVDASLVDVTLD